MQSITIIIIIIIIIHSVSIGKEAEEEGGLAAVG